jgi:hypothetical protein
MRGPVHPRFDFTAIKAQRIKAERLSEPSPRVDQAPAEDADARPPVPPRRSMASPISAARLSPPESSRQQEIADRLKAAEQRLKRAVDVTRD